MKRNMFTSMRSVWMSGVLCIVLPTWGESYDKPYVVNYFDTNEVFKAKADGTNIDFSDLLSSVVCYGVVASGTPGEMRAWAPDESERIRIADLYLLHGADPNATNSLGRTPAEEAILQNYEQLAYHICTYKGPNQVTQETLGKCVNMALKHNRTLFLVMLRLNQGRSWGAPETNILKSTLPSSP